MIPVRQSTAHVGADPKDGATQWIGAYVGTGAQFFSLEK